MLATRHKRRNCWHAQRRSALCHTFVPKQWREDKRKLNEASLLVALIVIDASPTFGSAPAFLRMSGSVQNIGAVVFPQGPAVSADGGLIFGRMSPHFFRVQTACAGGGVRAFPVAMGMKIIRAVLCLCALLAGGSARADLVTRLPTNDKVVALTFDACEGWEGVSFDRQILEFLLLRQIPFTLFTTGKFVENNASDIKMLAALDFVDIENHSWDHPNTMNRFAPQAVEQQIERAQESITRATGRAPQFFRFPAGKFNARGLEASEALGLHVVHWRWASGDPSERETADRLIARTMTNVVAGDILIFHINGRGIHTAEALPEIIDRLQADGYRFVLVSDYVGQPRPRKPSGEAPMVVWQLRVEDWLTRLPAIGLRSALR